MDPGTKECSKCRARLPLDRFHRNCATRDGRHTACRECRCSYSAMVTDLSYKSERARACYEMQRSRLKAKRVALRMLLDVEQRVAGWGSCSYAQHIGMVDPGVLNVYLPDETLTHVANLLSSHLGPHVYWAGYGGRWTVACEEVPPVALRDARDRTAYVRALLRPDNVVFRRLDRRAADATAEARDGSGDVVGDA